MRTVAARELREQTDSLLERVAGGEQIAITVDGRPVAVLAPLPRRTLWMKRELFLHRFAAHRADPALRDELTALAPDTTDDLPR